MQIRERNEQKNQKLQDAEARIQHERMLQRQRHQEYAREKQEHYSNQLDHQRANFRDRISEKDRRLAEKHSNAESFISDSKRMRSDFLRDVAHKRQSQIEHNKSRERAILAAKRNAYSDLIQQKED